MNIHILLVIILFVFYSKSSEKEIVQNCSLNSALTKSDQEGNLTVGIKTYIRCII